VLQGSEGKKMTLEKQGWKMVVRDICVRTEIDLARESCQMKVLDGVEMNERMVFAVGEAKERMNRLPQMQRCKRCCDNEMYAFRGEEPPNICTVSKSAKNGRGGVVSRNSRTTPHGRKLFWDQKKNRFQPATLRPFSLLGLVLCSHGQIE
jgi:hypothetical protein